MVVIEDCAPDHMRFHLTQAMFSYVKRSDSFNDGLHFVDESINCQQYKEEFWIIFEEINQVQYY